MLHRTISRYRQFAVYAIIVFSLTGCSWDAALQGHDLEPSEYAIKMGFPSLLPRSHFRIADYQAPDPTDLAARFAMLKRIIPVLNKPVISSYDRARMEAAVKRTAENAKATQG